MRIGNYDITMKNIWAYIQGNSRKIADDFGPDIFKSPRHIQEQIIWREVIHDKRCFKAGKCIVPGPNGEQPCNCKVPDKFYSDKACEGGCYPKIMDKNTWDKFKQITLRRKIDIYNDKFDWDVILMDIELKDDLYYNSLIDVNNAIVHLGTIKLGDLPIHKFEIFNPFDEDLTINSVMPSCSCVSTIIPKPIESNEYGILEAIVDTRNKQVGYHEVWLTILYNNIKRINLQLKFNIK